MVHKVPVISSDAGGISEVNLDGYSGYISKIGDIEAMSNKAIALLLDPEKHQKFKQQAFEQARKFDLYKVIHQYEKVYERALAKINS